MPKLTEEHKAKALEFSVLLDEIPSELRGDFLMLIADNLTRKTQFYTSSLIRSAARKYSNGLQP